METRHINYKSDFVIRERFRDGTGKVVALPDVDFELRYWVGSHSVKATRKDGVYTGCVPDGDGLLVIFKDHGLGEGELHHELHLALDNALFENGGQNVYYPESLHIWLWDKMGDTEGVVESDCVAAYTRGYKFTWEDFTAADIIVLRLYIVNSTPLIAHHFTLGRGRWANIWFGLCLLLLIGVLAFNMGYGKLF